MATFYRCDRCHKEERNCLQRIEIPAPVNRNDYKNERNIDLCNDCVVKLNQLVDALPMVKQG